MEKVSLREVRRATKDDSPKLLSMFVGILLGESGRVVGCNTRTTFDVEYSSRRARVDILQTFSTLYVIYFIVYILF